MKKFINISVPTLISAGAAVASIIALICCAIAGKSLGQYSGVITLLIILGAVCELIPLFVDTGAIAPIAGSVLTLAGFLDLTCIHLNKIGLIFAGVVEEKVPAAFYIAAVFAILAAVACAVVAFMGTEKKEPLAE